MGNAVPSFRKATVPLTTAAMANISVPIRAEALPARSPNGAMAMTVALGCTRPVMAMMANSGTSSATNPGMPVDKGSMAAADSNSPAMPIPASAPRRMRSGECLLNSRMLICDAPMMPMAFRPNSRPKYWAGTPCRVMNTNGEPAM